MAEQDATVQLHGTKPAQKCQKSFCKALAMLWEPCHPTTPPLHQAMGKACFTFLQVLCFPPQLHLHPSCLRGREPKSWATPPAFAFPARACSRNSHLVPSERGRSQPCHLHPSLATLGSTSAPQSQSSSALQAANRGCCRAPRLVPGQGKHWQTQQ